MTDPYNWSFPQRNETMFMATIGTPLVTQKTASTSIAPCVSPPSKRQTFQVLFPNAKSHSLSTAITTRIRPSCSPSHRATSCATNTSRPTIYARVTSRRPTPSTMSSRQTESQIQLLLGTNFPMCPPSSQNHHASSSGTLWTSPISPPNTGVLQLLQLRKSPSKAQRRTSCLGLSTQ